MGTFARGRYAPCTRSYSQGAAHGNAYFRCHYCSNLLLLLLVVVVVVVVVLAVAAAAAALL